ncbi:hypothetical protein [Oceanidesulfovibrio marinus]|uniref:Uncharacterized protein n=1 Tax=Oceanidesulfovibrio marinus TaxID=370038 RepID=A0A6P1ZFD0_9BACT|nr:hypothetical protein [Oceanidesulfovibrio marinus]QJT07685.1 hypothetical protein E8L03_01535 [Oceanidesulfovibrio marinus]TVM32042.1 hypothetical protein DQK91_16030 [Oceanidesulfovibrio marinus]
MQRAISLLDGASIETDEIVWTNGDTEGFTPFDTPMTLEYAEQYAFPDKGIYGDRRPWAFFPEAGEDKLGRFHPVRLESD